MENKRRDFLKKSLKIGAVGAVGVAASQALAKSEQDYGDTVRGKSPKKDYKVAY